MPQFLELFICFFKVINRNTRKRKRCEICSEFTIKTLEKKVPPPPPLQKKSVTNENWKLIAKIYMHKE